MGPGAVIQDARDYIQADYFNGQPCCWKAPAVVHFGLYSGPELKGQSAILAWVVSFDDRSYCIQTWGHPRCDLNIVIRLGSSPWGAFDSRSFRTAVAIGP